MNNDLSHKLKNLAKGLAGGLVLSFSMSCVQAAEYYTWVDENGVVNYSQKAPSGIEAEHVSQSHTFGRRRSQSAPRTAPPPIPDQTAQTAPAESAPVAEGQNEEVAQMEASLTAEIQATKRQNCRQARRNLESFQSRGRVRYTGPDGEMQIMSDEDKQARINSFRQQIRDNC